MDIKGFFLKLFAGVKKAVLGEVIEEIDDAKRNARELKDDLDRKEDEEKARKAKEVLDYVKKGADDVLSDWGLPAPFRAEITEPLADLLRQGIQKVNEPLEEGTDKALDVMTGWVEDRLEQLKAIVRKGID